MKFRGIFCFWPVLCGLLMIGSAQANDALESLESSYFNAYDKLHEQAIRFQAEVVKVRPPVGHAFSEKDLAGYHAQLEALYAKKPEYREMALGDAKTSAMAKRIASLVGANESEIGQFEASYHISRMTGLSHREMAVIQKAGGLSDLRKLIWSVENLPNRQWVSWYLMLIGHGDDKARKSLFLDDGSEYPEAAARRMEYGARVKVFDIAREKLKQAETTALEAANDPMLKNRLAVKLFIHRNISGKAGRVGWGHDNRGGYPLEKADENRYPEAKLLSDKLGVPFGDMAFIKKAEGNSGLRKVVKDMAWIPDREAILVEAIK